MAAVRSTPADPTPGGRTVARETGDQRAMPPELGPNSLAVLSGPTFMYSDQSGDVPPGSIGGLVHLDTRLLSRWVLTVNGARLLVLRAETIDHYSAQYVLTNPDVPGLPPDSLGIRRLRYVGDGFHERVELVSFRPEPVQVQLRLAVDADFADLFEVKSVVQDAPRASPAPTSPASCASPTRETGSARRPASGARCPPTGWKATSWCGTSRCSRARAGRSTWMCLCRRGSAWWNRSGATSPTSSTGGRMTRCAGGQSSGRC
ncbi:hypothetical protein HDA35_004515 [Micromonospora purpureochromogenes]|uniref:Putative glycogen debranching enzyme N-terminal domain-containing protein n=1 Tax=Micromonospora purpureochromogenes TaxID=47872 RepID=A0ABX2RQ78_9ACTN|nr:hypothetical protein [Micromonospora purpureochromogenes]